MHRHRPTSEWEPVYITNIQIVISLLNYVLGRKIDIPKHVKDSKSIVSFTEHDDNLCFFRCLAWHESQTRVGLEVLTHQKFQQCVEYTPVKLGVKFLGVNLLDIPDLENCFQMNINVFQLLENQTVITHYKSLSNFEGTMYLDLQEHHLSYVKDVNVYAKRFQCQRCDRLFNQYFNLKRHYRTCSNVTTLNFPGGFHKVHQTVFEELEKYGIRVAKRDRIFLHFITYDFESVLKKLDRDPSNKLVWEEKHVPISVGVGSNVEGFEDGVCYVDYDLDALLSQMLERMHTIAQKVKRIQKEKFSWVYLRLEHLINSFKEPIQAPVLHQTTSSSSSCSPSNAGGACGTFEENACEVDDYEPPSKKFAKRVNMPNSFDGMIARLRETDELRTEFHRFIVPMKVTVNWKKTKKTSSMMTMRHQTKGQNEYPIRGQNLEKQCLQGRFDDYCSCVPVLGFNSSKYDLNLVKSKLCKHLELTNLDTRSFTVKRNNSYLTICTPSLKFLDISHYIAPGYSYAQFLKSYKAQEKKSFFCYQYLTDPAVLEETRLPPYEAFYSKLKQCNVLEQEMICWQKKHNVSFLYQKRSRDTTSPYLDRCLKQICPLCSRSCCACRDKQPLSGFQNYMDLKRLWKECNMQTVKDFFVYYNLKDIDPFTEAVSNLQKFYFENEIDLFKDTISVPGAARQLLFRSKDANFALFNHQNEDLYRKIKQNICGGPSIVFTTSMKVGQRMKSGEETCAKILGFDANALYPYCLQKEMPCGA